MTLDLFIRRAWLAIALLPLIGCNTQTAPNPQMVSEPSGELEEDIADFLPPPKDTVNPPAVIPRFERVAKSSGVDFTFFSDTVPGRYFLPEIMGGGAAWIDIDLDGWLDLYLMNGAPLVPTGASQAETGFLNRLFQNRGDGQFLDVSARSSCFQNADAGNRYGQGVAAGDYDSDGFPDLYLANYGKNVLLHNNGDGTFRDVTDESGVGDQLWSTSPIWLDIDGDSLLDLYVTNYLLLTAENSKICEYDGVVGYCGPGSYDAAPDRAFISQGDGSFVEMAEAYGLLQPRGKGLAIAALDFDNDLRAEIYVANDMTENFLFTRGTGYRADDGSNAAQPLYSDIGALAGCGVSATGENEASMGVASADFDGDQLVDLFLTHYYSHKNTLYRNLGNLSFVDDSRRSRIAATSYETLGFGTVPFDYDRDSDVDLFITNGHVLGPKHSPSVMPPQLLLNDGVGRFTDISEFSGSYFQELWLGRGAAGGDYDNDGDLDLVVTHIGQPVELLRNDTQTNHAWIGVELRTLNRIVPVGGRVVVTFNNNKTKITMPVVAGGSYLCSSDSRMLFGLGEQAGAVQIEIYWPSGRVDKFEDLAVNRYWRISEEREPEPVPSSFNP